MGDLLSRIMGDLRDARLMYLKGGLFVLLGGLAAAGVLVICPDWRVALFLALAIWGFCRAYYFAFYVVEHYIDGGYRFAGLGDFARYLWRKRRPGQRT